MKGQKRNLKVTPEITICNQKYNLLLFLLPPPSLLSFLPIDDTVPIIVNKKD